MFSDSNYGYVWGACDRTVLGTHKYTHSTDTHTCLPNVHALTQGEYFHGGSVLFQWVATGWGVLSTQSFIQCCGVTHKSVGIVCLLLSRFTRLLSFPFHDFSFVPREKVSSDELYKLGLSGDDCHNHRK